MNRSRTIIPLPHNAKNCSQKVCTALQKYAIGHHPVYGNILAYEVDGYGNQSFMDDANVPNLLALPYLGAMPASDPLYQSTRKFVLSNSNPYFFKGKAAEGVGGPHVGLGYIWPMSIIIRALTSNNPTEITTCLKWLKTTHAGTGFMHESFNKDNPADFTRKWFAANQTQRIGDKNPPKPPSNIEKNHLIIT